MHQTAMRHGQLFFETYVTGPETVRIVDVGAQDVNGSLRSVAPRHGDYVGVDFVAGKGVDVVIDDPYKLPFDEASFDVCVSSSCFEHSEFFWLSFLEILRILKPGGLLYINVPSNGLFHRHPVDCWRFYPDSGVALQNWARRSGINATMLESFVGLQESGVWNDFIAVFVKDDAFAASHPRRIQTNFSAYSNGRLGGEDGFTNFEERPEDLRTLCSRLKWKVRRKLGCEPD